MIQDIAPRQFHNEYLPREAREEDFVAVFFGSHKREDLILLRTADSGLPTVGELVRAGILAARELTYLFSIDDRGYFLLRDGDRSRREAEGFSYQKLRSLRGVESPETSFAGVTAYHLFTWYRDNRFCGRCGQPLAHHESIRAMVCPVCEELFFPRIAPAVIIGVRNKEKLLISHYAGREYKGRALLAGFCEIGETPEETVRREVMEEVGLRVTNLSYFGSQPWGFDSNLLLGYFADVDGDTRITLDEEELANAVFVPREDLEYEENLRSLTATMIEAFRLGNA